MARVYTYAMLTVGLLIALFLLGIEIGANCDTEDGCASTYFGLFDGKITDSQFYDEIVAILGLVVAGGLIIGLLARGQVENLMLAPFILGPLIILASVMTRMITFFNDSTYPAWGQGIMLLLFGMLLVGYVISLAEWFRGNI